MRYAEGAIKDNAEQGAAAGKADAVGERGVVGENGADAGEDGVGGVAEELRVGAGRGAGDPVWRGGCAGGSRRREFAVDGERGFERDEGTAMLNGEGEGVVKAASLLGQGMGGIEEVDFDVGGAEFGKALSADEGVRVNGGDDAAGDACGNECVGTGAGTAVVRARFEGDVGRGSANAVVESGGLLEGCDLGVVARVVVVRALTEDDVVAGENAADAGVGAGEGSGFLREG